VTAAGLWHTLRFRVPAGQPLYISAQSSAGYGSLACTIEVNGRIIAQHSSKGNYVVVSCSGLS
jgi:hypothetical protein